MKYIIKFVSADGLTRYEERESNRRPDEVLARKGLYEHLVVTRSLEMPKVEFAEYIHRAYKLWDQTLHPETGQYIFEYREQP